MIFFFLNALKMEFDLKIFSFGQRIKYVEDVGCSSGAASLKRSKRLAHLHLPVRAKQCPKYVCYCLLQGHALGMHVLHVSYSQSDFVSSRSLSQEFVEVTMN